MRPVISLPPAEDEGVPLYVRLARAITADIVRGRLAPGVALPGTRTLASTLGIHRNTVLAAFGELAAEGWVTTRPSGGTSSGGTSAGGTYVSSALPERAPRRFSNAAPTRTSVPERAAFPLGDEPDHEARFDFGASRLAGAVPDVRLVPREALARAVRRVLKRKPALLDYGGPSGEAALRVALADMLSSQRGLCAGADDVLVTQGSQMALDLVARALIRRGDVVAVEALSYGPAREAFRAAGARLLPIPLDARGLDVSALAGRGVRMVYVTPHHQYPTTVTLAPERRLALLELARRERFAILEDDYDHEFHYDGRPVFPLASADAAGSVIYVGTLSKLLAPALRIGFVVAPRAVQARLTRLRAHADRHGDRVMQAAVAELIEDGELGRHARRMRRIYEGRRDAFVLALRRNLGGAVRFVQPSGGMALWFEAEPTLDVDAWAASAHERGFGFPTARTFSLDDRAGAGGRWAFAPSTERELVAACEVLAQTLPRPIRPKPSQRRAVQRKESSPLKRRRGL